MKRIFVGITRCTRPSATYFMLFKLVFVAVAWIGLFSFVLLSVREVLYTLEAVSEFSRVREFFVFR